MAYYGEETTPEVSGGRGENNGEFKTTTTKSAMRVLEKSKGGKRHRDGKGKDSKGSDSKGSDSKGKDAK